MDEQLKVLNEIVKLLSSFDKDTQTRIIATVALMLDVPRVKHVVVE